MRPPLRRHHRDLCRARVGLPPRPAIVEMRCHDGSKDGKHNQRLYEPSSRLHRLGRQPLVRHPSSAVTATEAVFSNSGPPSSLIAAPTDSRR